MRIDCYSALAAQFGTFELGSDYEVLEAWLRPRAAVVVFTSQRLANGQNWAHVHLTVAGREYSGAAVSAAAALELAVRQVEAVEAAIEAAKAAAG